MPRHPGARPKAANPGSITPAVVIDSGFAAFQVGCSRLGRYTPISGKPEIGGAPE